MSTGVVSTWNPQGDRNAGNWSQYAVSTSLSHNGQFTASASPIASTSATPTPTTTAYNTWQPPAHWKVDPQQPQTQAYGQVQQQQSQKPSLPSYVKKVVKGKGRTKEEEEIIAETAARFAAKIKEDQEAVLNPDVDTPFQDEADVVKRLLPYHIFQQPKEDLDTVIYGKGKGKAPNYDLKTEVQETKFAIECHKRQERLRARWRRIIIRQGESACPKPQAYVLAQAVLETDRSETASLSTELRAARAELERIQREQRAAQSAAPRVTSFSVAPSASGTASQTHAQQAQYYRPYPYAYSQQPYGSSSTGSTTLTFPATPAPQPSTAYMYQPGNAIPVQLPVSSLPALNQLGVVPVPATMLPPEGQPQPAAILRGASANGTTLNLEINVSLLQPAQMSGLAVILNDIVARGASHAASSAAAATAATPTSSYSTNGFTSPVAEAGKQGQAS